MKTHNWMAALLMALSGLTAAQAQPAAITPFSLAAPGDALPSPWQHRPLPKVERQNQFTLVQDRPNGQAQTVLRIDSAAAASTLAHPLAVDPGEHPWLVWRWKVSAPVAGSDFLRKEGDDYAARVYVLFDYPVQRLSFGERAAISLARVLHGAELPTAALAYVWGTAQAAGAIGPNPYTDRVRMVVVDSGAARAGQWVRVQRNVAEDFRAAFGEEAPPIIGIAVAADTDNTGEAVTAWFADLRLEAAQ